MMEIREEKEEMGNSSRSNYRRRAGGVTQW
jgi:hypothetical protein